MCGEHFSCLSIFDISLGSSPHVRGAHGMYRHAGRTKGIIPACAGSTCSRSDDIGRPGDHPRMCGEHLVKFVLEFGEQGSSPHVRGALALRVPYTAQGGIIPACAGSTVQQWLRAEWRRDHPRMCGEHKWMPVAHSFHRGSSPHVRGALSIVFSSLSMFGIIPACAGSTGSRPACHQCHRDHPRMCGEHCRLRTQDRASVGSSPHVRGAHRPRVKGKGMTGIIPACAGSTSARAGF